MESVKKTPKKKRVRFERKTIIAGTLIAALAITGIMTGFFITRNSKEGGHLIYGFDTNPLFFDPIEANIYLDYFTLTIIDQVAEGLFKLDFVDNVANIKPNLAISYTWGESATEFTCYLREGVFFHDGVKFNASAVKWNIDRTLRLINNTDVEVTWKLPSGKWIINKTMIMDEYTIKFTLNEPYVPFKGLLAQQFSYIFSPKTIPEDDFISYDPENLFGTGPFIYDEYIEDSHVTLLPNLNYWGGRPIIDKLTLAIITNDTLRYEAMLSKQLSMTFPGSWDLDTLNNTEGITVLKYVYPESWYLWMNNEIMPVEMRKALSYSFNYTHYFKYFVPNAIRLRSPIPKTILYSNWEDFKVPNCNLTIARQALKDANWPGTINLTANDDISPGNEWELIANSSTPLELYNFSYIYNFHTTFGNLLVDNFKQIGVKVELCQMSGLDFLYKLNELSGFHRNMLELFMVGMDHAFAYMDPSFSINPMFSNVLPNWNYAQVNDSVTQLWMEQALVETNDTAREELYYNIQKQLIEKIFPLIWLRQTTYYHIYVSNLRGFNPYWVFFKDVYFI